MKALVLCACMIAIGCLPLKAVVSESEAKKLAVKISGDYLPKIDQLSIVWQLSPEDRDAVCKAIRSMATHEWATTDKSSIKMRLVDCYDEEATHEAVEAYLNDPFHNSGIFTSGNPRVVELLAPVMFREEAWTETTGDTPGEPLSYETAMLSLRLLGQSPAFNADVTAWARRNIVVSTLLRRDAMRDWWRENERFFKAKDYKAVRPGRDIALTNSPEGRQALIDRGFMKPDGTPAATAPPAATPAPPTTPQAASLPPTPTPDLVPPPTNFNPIPIAAALSVLLLVTFGVLYLKRRKDS